MLDKIEFYKSDAKTYMAIYFRDGKKHIQPIVLNKHLGKETIEKYIEKVTDTIIIESGKQILLVVKLIFPKKRPEGITKFEWKNYKKRNKNVWGVKVV